MYFFIDIHFYILSYKCKRCDGQNKKNYDIKINFSQKTKIVNKAQKGKYIKLMIL